MQNKNSFLLLLFFVFLIPFVSNAQDVPQFLFPVSCKLGEDCWAVNYVDTDPTEGEAKDLECKHRTYDGHKGTDFAVRSTAEMEFGVDVLAAADGKVLRFRDGETDTVKAKVDLDLLEKENKNCGNGIIIDHGSGIFTQYCHLKMGSIQVKAGQRVKMGDKIAQIGHSGFTEFPHLHFQIMWEGAIMDPFTGLKSTDSCETPPAKPLWHIRSPITYQGTRFFDAGFSGKKPDFKAIQRGEQSPDVLSKDGEALVFWVALYGAEKGDKVNIVITDPEGSKFTERNIIQDRYRARQYYYTGRNLAGKNPKPGRYSALATLRSPGKPDQTIRRQMILR